MNIKSLVKKNYLLLIFLALTIPFYFLLYKIYIPRITAFGCFDDCFSFTSAFFMNHGKRIFTDFFFNHNMLNAYLSQIIQNVTTPDNAFELILRHRQFLLLISFVANVFLILRFRYPAIIFVVVYELSKFYIFGDRFLGESFIVYPAVYLTGLCIEKALKKKLYSFDYLLCGFFIWYIAFTREPYAPLALFFLVYIFWDKTFDLAKKIGLGILVALTCLTLLSVNMSDYIFNVWTVNANSTITQEFSLKELPGPHLLQMFFYPIYIFLFGQWNLFRILLIGINIVFLIQFVSILKQKRYSLAALIFVVLGIANIRVVLPGFLFYGSFHMVIWYGMFIFTTSYLMLQGFNKKVLIPSVIIFASFFIYFVTNKQYFAYEKIDQQTQFITNYGATLQRGAVLKALSSGKDTIFLDGSDDLVYWIAQRMSPYKYTWYTSAMPMFNVYTKERDVMFKTNPPTFYVYGFDCSNISKDPKAFLPKYLWNKYVQLNEGDKPSCIFMLKSKESEISESQWQEASKWLYNLPNEKD